MADVFSEADAKYLCELNERSPLEKIQDPRCKVVVGEKFYQFKC